MFNCFVTIVIYYKNNLARFSAPPNLRSGGLGFSKMRRTNTYIDGFNLYYSFKRTQSLKWTDLNQLARKLIRPKTEIVSNVYYFSALAEWDELAIQRHKAYIEALEQEGVEVILGWFKYDKKEFREIGKNSFKNTKPEEKETDVALASYMLRDALMNRVDKIILVSADSDDIPTIKIIKHEKPNVEIEIRIPQNQGTSRKYKQLEKSGLISITRLKDELLKKCRFVGKDSLIPEAYKV